MRNYVLVLCLPFDVQQIPPVGPTITFTEALWAATDSELMSKYIARQAVIRSNIPADTYIFTSREIQKIYWTLDQRNFINILDLNATYYWNLSQGSQGPLNTDPALVDQALLNQSPRSFFPTELGTDGQRLKQNKPKSTGDALNYLAKLYFLTSRRVFFDLFQALKSSKISAKQALAEANALT